MLKENYPPELTLGSKLKKASDLLFEEVNAIYKSKGLNFNSRLFSAIQILKIRQSSNIQQLANELGISHPAAIGIVKELIKLGLVRSKVNKQDKRNTKLSLSTEGKTLIRKLSPLWLQIGEAVQNILNSNAPQLVHQLSALEHELKLRSLNDRISLKPDLLVKNDLQIIEWDEKYKQSFADLNLEWIEKYFEVEKKDLEILLNPAVNIIKNGGMIFFVRYGALIVGTCALLKEGQGFELTKMAVSQAFQGKGIGGTLLKHILNWARMNKAHFITLETASSLKTAIRLYKSLGFKQLRGSKKASEYARADVYMRIDL